MKTLFAALAMLSFGASSSVAYAENPFAQDSTLLQLHDLDLKTADGQQRLAMRMDAASRTVCGDRVAALHLALGEQARDCRARVVADIRSQIEARMAAADDAKVQLASR